MKHLNMRFLIISVILAALLLHGCGGGNSDNQAASGSVAVTDIILSSNTVNLNLDDTRTYQINPAVRPSNASDKTLKYVSNNEAVATVGENGLITAISAGTAVITVSSAASTGIQKSITVNVTAGGSGGNIDDTGTDIKWDNLPASPITGAGGSFEENLPDPDNKVTPENILALVGHYRIQYMTIQSPDGFKVVDNIKGSGDNMRGEIAVNAVPCDSNPTSCPIGLTIQIQFKSQFHPDIINQGIPESVHFIRKDIYSPLSSMDIPGEFAKLGAEIIEDTAKPGEYAVKFTLNSPDLPMPKGYTMAVTLKKIADDTIANPQIILDNSKYFIESEGGSVPVSGITVNNKNIGLEAGGTASISYGLFPVNATNKNVSFSSDKPSVASVDGHGIVTAHEAGTAAITVTTEDGAKTDTAQVTVTAKTVLVESVDANLTNVSLDINPAENKKDADITIKAMPENATNRTLKVKTNSNPSALQAILRDKGDGTYTLTLTAAASSGTPVTVTVVSESNENAEASITVNISDTTIYPESVTLSDTSKTLVIGDTFTLTANVFPADAYNKNLEFFSNNVSVAQVDKTTGLVTALGEGSAEITVKTTDGGKTDVCAVTVNKPYIPVTGITMDSTVTFGDTATDAYISAEIQPADASDKTVTYSVTAGSDVISVDAASGKITILKAGTATVKASSADNTSVSAYCTVTIASSVIPVQSISITNKPQPSTAESEIKLNGTRTYSIGIEPSNATTQTFSVESSDSGVLSVIHDSTNKTILLTAEKAGTATITVKSGADNNITDTATFTVWETADITGSYSVQSLNITYNGKTVKSAEINNSKSYHYDNASLAISAVANGNLDVSGKFQLVWSAFIDDPVFDIFRYKYFDHSESITERELGTDKLNEKNITLNSDGTIIYVFPFDINGDRLVYNASSPNSIELVLNNKSPYNQVTAEKWRQVTPVNFEDPYSIGGAYDMLTFVQTNSQNVNVGAAYYYETGNFLNKVKGNSLNRMIGEVSIKVETSHRTIDMDSKIQMNSPRLRDKIFVFDVSEQQFSVTNYQQVIYALDQLVNNKTFGNGNAKNAGTVTPSNDIWENQTSDIKIYSAFKESIANVEVSVFAKKKSDIPITIDGNTAYYCTGAFYRPSTAACPSSEPDESKGIVTQLWN